LVPLSFVAQSGNSASLTTLVKVKRKELGKPNKSQCNLIGIPDVRMGDGLGGRGCWKKRMPYCNGVDRAANGGDTQLERVQTSCAGLNDRES
jgi:hypothetical protein